GRCWRSRRARCQGDPRQASGDDEDRTGAVRRAAAQRLQIEAGRLAGREGSVRRSAGTNIAATISVGAIWSPSPERGGMGRGGRNVRGGDATPSCPPPFRGRDDLAPGSQAWTLTNSWSFT